MTEYTWMHDFGGFQVLQLAVLQDNYSYLIHDKNSGATAAIDPADDPKILAELAKRRWVLQAIWNTHWHADHCGGNEALLEYAKQARHKVEVAAYSSKKITECTQELRAGQTLTLENLQFQVEEVPGHTLDHVLFSCQIQTGKTLNSLVFCGDTLFSLGCGRLFEGTAAQMLQSLDRIASFPPQTLLFCAHEYTRTNLRFALSLEKENLALQTFARNLITNRDVTVPSTLAFELEANPFLRLRHESFSRAVAKQLPNWPMWSAQERLSQIRKMKDHFQ